jgi:hypothetical protein
MPTFRLGHGLILIASCLACASTPLSDQSDTFLLLALIPTELGANRFVFENTDTGRKVSVVFERKAVKVEPVQPGRYQLVRVGSLYDNVLGGAIPSEYRSSFEVERGVINYAGAVRVGREASTHSRVALNLKASYPPEAVEAARANWPDVFAAYEVRATRGIEPIIPSDE